MEGRLLEEEGGGSSTQTYLMKELKLIDSVFGKAVYLPLWDSAVMSLSSIAAARFASHSAVSAVKPPAHL